MLSHRCLSLILAAGIALSGHAFAPMIISGRSSTALMAKGRRSLRKTVAGGSSGSSVKPMGGEMASNKKNNWVPVKGFSSMKDLPKDENVVTLVDTMADPLMNGATNPNGAVSVVNYDGKTYCFSSSCSSCKIPLTKAKVLPANEETDNVHPRLSCDFCKATYNVRTGERVADAGETGLMGGIVKGLFSAQEKAPLPIYDLGEKNGQVLINLP